MKKQPRFWILTSLCSFFIIALSLALYSWWEDTLWEESLRLADEAEISLKYNQPDRAINLYYAMRQRGYGPGFLESRWERVAAEAYVQLDRPLELTALYLQDASSIYDNERAALMVLETLYSRNQPDSAEELRDAWRTRETDRTAWIILDADFLMRTGNLREAGALLGSTSFEGKAEAHRLLRLSLLQTDPGQAIFYLDKASEVDPSNPDVLYTRAWVFEAQGRSGDALEAFARIQSTDLSNPLYREILGNFLFRQGKREEALVVWSGGLDRSPNDSLWFKSFFWGKMLSPVALSSPPKNSTLSRLIAFSETVPQNRFWDNKRFSRISSASLFRHELQEVYWLTFLECMRTGRSADLVRSYEYAPNWSYFNPETRLAVYSVAVIRGARPDGALEELSRLGSQVPHGMRHPLFVELQENAEAQLNNPQMFTLSQPTQSLLDSGSIYTAILLADGLPEAALKVGAKLKAKPDYPDWFVLSYARALQQNRSLKAAVAFLPEGRSVELEVYRGELAFMMGNRERAANLLVPHAQSLTSAGQRAAYLLSVDSLDQQDALSAQSWLKGNRALSKSIKGKELSAQIAIVRGDLAFADKQMRSIQKHSFLAQDYLASRRHEARLKKNRTYLAEY